MLNLKQEMERRSRSGSDISLHLPRLYQLASVPEAKIIELGVRSGDSTCALLAAVSEQNGELWSVDINSPRTPPDWLDLPYWYVSVGNDLELVYFMPDQVDLVFIDTSHTYEQTKLELNYYWSKVKSGGKIVLHDTELERPDASPISDPDYPVRVAVQEFCDEMGFDVEWVAGCYGLAIISIM